MAENLQSPVRFLEKPTIFITRSRWQTILFWRKDKNIDQYHIYIYVYIYLQHLRSLLLNGQHHSCTDLTFNFHVVTHVTPTLHGSMATTWGSCRATTISQHKPTEPDQNPHPQKPLRTGSVFGPSGGVTAEDADLGSTQTSTKTDIQFFNDQMLKSMESTSMTLCKTSQCCHISHGFSWHFSWDILQSRKANFTRLTHQPSRLAVAKRWRCCPSPNISAFGNSQALSWS